MMNRHLMAEGNMKTVLVLGLASLLLAGTVSAGGFSHSQQAEVEDLVVCYARGTDLLGSAVNAVPTGDNLDSTINTSDPVFAEALALYRRCFSTNFSFTLEFDGVPALTVPNPATRTPNTDAALQWANFVNNAFRGPGYKSTQHHMGSISSELNGQQAQVVSYLIATHVFGPSGEEPEGSVSVVGGTYTDRVVRERGTWLIEQRTLNITSSVITRAE
jgi:hypothetical protein